MAIQRVLVDLCGSGAAGYHPLNTQDCTTNLQDWFNTSASLHLDRNIADYGHGFREALADLGVVATVQALLANDPNTQPYASILYNLSRSEALHVALRAAGMLHVLKQVPHCLKGLPAASVSVGLVLMAMCILIVLSPPDPGCHTCFVQLIHLLHSSCLVCSSPKACHGHRMWVVWVLCGLGRGYMKFQGLQLEGQQAWQGVE
jgi:hypothetical protein